jgi:hypothetical protein
MNYIKQEISNTNTEPEARGFAKLYNAGALLNHRPVQNIKTEYLYSKQKVRSILE